MLKLFSFLFLVGLLIPFNLYSQTVPDYIEGKLFVKVKEGFTTDISFNGEVNRQDFSLSAIVKTYNVERVYSPFLFEHSPLEKAYVLDFKRTRKTREIIKELEALPYIEYAEQVPNYQLFFTPNDLDGNQWYLKTIQAEQAWDISTGPNAITIAIIDDAVRLSHEDLVPALWINPGEIPNNGIDDDGNGYIDDINGYDVSDNDNDPNPPNTATNYEFTHGTHSAGIAAAATDNNVGIASLCFNSKIMAVKTKPDNMNGPSVPDAFLGLQYAVLSGAQVINMSWGGPAYSQTYQNLITEAYNRNIVVVGAAGNSGTSVPMYPASYDHVISVGATKEGDTVATFSNYGPFIDVMAPGERMWGTLAGGDSEYDYKHGSSMGAPLTSGLCALMISYRPGLTPDEVENCLEASCDNIDAINPALAGQIGAGRINALKALQCLQRPPVAEFTANYDTICTGDTITFSHKGVGTPPTQWIWHFPGGRVQPVDTLDSAFVANPKVIYDTNGTYTVTLIAINEFGRDTLTDPNYITIQEPVARLTALSDTDTICTGDTATIFIEFTGNPPWSFTYDDGSGNQTIDSIMVSPYEWMVTPRTTTTYNFISMTDSFCSGSVVGDTAVVVQSCCPADIDIDFEYRGMCHYDSTAFFLINNSRYIADSVKWFFGDPASGAQDTSANIDPWHLYNNPGTYNVTLIFYSECQPDTTTKSVTIYDCCNAPPSPPLATINVIRNKSLICTNDSIKFEVETNVSTKAGFLWNFGPDATPDTSFEEEPTIIIPSQGHHHIELIIKDSCLTDTIELQLKIDLASIPLFEVNDTTPCLGDSTSFINRSVWDTSTSFTWIFPGMVPDTVRQMNPPPFIEYPNDSVYEVFLITEDNCHTDTFSQKIYVIPEPEKPFAGNDTTICQFESVELGETPISDFRYDWMPSTGISDPVAGDPTATPPQTTTYIMQVTDSTSGCQATDTVIINVVELPRVSTTPNDTIYKGEKSQIKATVTNKTDKEIKSYTWTPTNGLNCTGCSDPVASPNNTTIYTVEVEDTFGCKGQDRVAIIVIDCECQYDVPQAFSPNGDGKNDVIMARGQGCEAFEFSIFNRWGQMVFLTNDPNQGWDGTVDGKIQPVSAFVYYLRYQNCAREEVTKQGSITIIK